MTAWKLILVGALVIGVVYFLMVLRHGFRATDESTAGERALARAMRNLSIPRDGRQAKNPLQTTADNINNARDIFIDRCAGCHGKDGSGITQIGRNLYPKPPDLRMPQTQNLTDGEIHYIIQNGVRLTAMPA